MHGVVRCGVLHGLLNGAKDFRERMAGKLERVTQNISRHEREEKSGTPLHHVDFRRPSPRRSERIAGNQQRGSVSAVQRDCPNC